MKICMIDIIGVSVALVAALLYRSAATRAGVSVKYDVNIGNNGVNVVWWVDCY